MSSKALEKLLVAELNNGQSELKGDLFKYQSVFLDKVRPDPSNARYLPVSFISDKDAASFTRGLTSKNDLMATYHAIDRVLVGKGCFIICMPYGSINWKKASDTIESIVELAEHIKSSELIQAPTIFPLEEGNYQILTGHRRFLALVYAQGMGSAAQFKVYKTPPLLKKTKQFQENASRKDLPQYGKLTAFLNAKKELEVLSTARLKVGAARLTVKEFAERMGISMGAFDNYNVLTRYPCVAKAYQEGLRAPFTRVKKTVLEIEGAFIAKHKLEKLSVSDKQLIDEEIEKNLLGEKQTAPSVPGKIKFASVSSSETIKTLFSSNIFELDAGIDWDSVDWEDPKSVSDVISSVIDFIENGNQASNK